MKHVRLYPKFALLFSLFFLFLIAIVSFTLLRTTILYTNRAQEPKLIEPTQDVTFSNSKTNPLSKVKLNASTILVKLKQPLYLGTQTTSLKSRQNISDLPSNTLHASFVTQLKSAGAESIKPLGAQANPIAATQSLYSIQYKKGVDVKKAIDTLSKNPLVEFAQPDYVYSTNLTVNDPFFLDPNPKTVERSLEPYKGGFKLGTDQNQIGYQWNLKKVGYPQAWDYIGNKPVIVAVVDTGVDYNHPELINRVWYNTKEIANNGIDDDKNGYIDDIRGWDGIDVYAAVYNNTTGGEEIFKIDPDNDPMDQPTEVYFPLAGGPHAKSGGHGTFISGIIAAVENNKQGMAGMNPNAKIMALRGCVANGDCVTSNLIELIQYAVNNGAQVINMSWGSLGADIALRTVIEDYYRNKNIIFIAAAGNGGEGGIIWPAAEDLVMAVGATDEYDLLTSYSSTSDKFTEAVDVVAPGGGTNPANFISLRAKDTDMYCVHDQGCLDGKYTHTNKVVGGEEQYYRAAGTSFAAPEVSALASILLTRRNYKNFEIYNAIKNGTDKVGKVTGFDYAYGHGRINTVKTVSSPNVAKPKDTEWSRLPYTDNREWTFNLQPVCEDGTSPSQSTKYVFKPTVSHYIPSIGGSRTQIGYKIFSRFTTIKVNSKTHDDKFRLFVEEDINTTERWNFYNDKLKYIGEIPFKQNFEWDSWRTDGSIAWIASEVPSGTFTIKYKLDPYLCKPSPITWNIVLKALCSNGREVNLVSNRFSSSVTDYPSTNPIDIKPVATNGKISITSTTDEGSIYVGMIDRLGDRLTPIGTPADPYITYGTAFTPPKPYAYWNKRYVGPGEYTLTFKAPDDMCLTPKNQPITPAAQ